MAWPERPDNWRLGAKPVQESYAAVAEAVNVSDPVSMAVSDGQFEHCRSMLSRSIRVVEISTDDAWMRDIGPTFVLDGNGGRRGIDWHFNAWGGLEGGLYFPWDRDERVARKLVWLRPQEAGGDEQSFAEFARRSFLARPWITGAIFSMAPLDNVSRATVFDKVRRDTAGEWIRLASEPGIDSESLVDQLVASWQRRSAS